MKSIILKRVCECSDPGCPAHIGASCSIATDQLEILYRSDMDDQTGTAFCDACTNDAMESGVFTATRYCGNPNCPDCRGEL